MVVVVVTVKEHHPVFHPWVLYMVVLQDGLRKPEPRSHVLLPAGWQFHPVRYGLLPVKLPHVAVTCSFFCFKVHVRQETQDLRQET